MVKSTDKLLSDVIEWDSTILTTAPDALFTQLLFISALMMAVRNFVKVNEHVPVSDFSEQLIGKVAFKLTECAPTLDHPAAKCGKFMNFIVQSWLDFSNQDHGPEVEFVVPLEGLSFNPTYNVDPHTIPSSFTDHHSSEPPPSTESSMFAPPLHPPSHNEQLPFDPETYNMLFNQMYIPPPVDTSLSPEEGFWNSLEGMVGQETASGGGSGFYQGAGNVYTN